MPANLNSIVSELVPQIQIQEIIQISKKWRLFRAWKILVSDITRKKINISNSKSSRPKWGTVIVSKNTRRDHKILILRRTPRVIYILIQRLQVKEYHFRDSRSQISKILDCSYIWTVSIHYLSIWILQII